MYAALHEDRVVAVHDDLHVVNEFVEMQPNSNEFITAKLKNKKNKIAKYQELYLVICNGKYVPYNLYETMKDIVDCDNIISFAAVKGLISLSHISIELR